jgi:hypothetical protein
MADITYGNEGVNYRTTDVVITRPNWGAIWAGVFSFIAIWSIFGMLGAAIFASAANPNAPHPVTGMNVGMSIWAIILTIIAMFVAGRITGQLAGSENSPRMHAIVMFGLAVTAALLIVVIGGNSLGGTRLAGTNTPFLIGLFSDVAWPLFVSLFLGWLAAMGGAMSAHRQFPRPVARPQTSHAVGHAS